MALLYVQGAVMKVGDLVEIKKSFSQKAIGKLAIVVKIWICNATIVVLDNGSREDYDIKKLEVLS